jgi:uncharacterized protein GlcG (DUF336 family)
MRSILTAAALGAALMMSTGTFAQVPADTSNPNEATAPEQANRPAYGESISLENAKKVAASAQEEAKKRNWNIFCISIVGPSGELVYFERQDNCQMASINISQHKARTAARYRNATINYERLIAKGAHFTYLTTLDDIIASRGGNPLLIGGKVVGAIGVSGGTGSQDDVLSLAGAAALK